MAEEQGSSSWWPLHEAGGPYGSVLRLGDVHILLDCGSDAALSEACLDRYATVASKIDLVLLSHYDVRHVGALAAARARGLTAPVYATMPTAKMGCVVMYDTWAALRASRGRDYCDGGRLRLDDVDAAFNNVRPLKFEQPLEVLARGARALVISAHRAGHSVGGAFWRVRCGADAVVYAVDVHHATERHVAGGDLGGTAERPGVLITDAAALGRRAAASRRDAEDKAVDAAVDALRHGGHALLPIDAVGRLLELGLAFDEAWRKRQLGGAYDLVMVHSMARNVVEFAKSQLEWMAPDVQRQFDANSGKNARHPLALAQVRVVSSVAAALSGRPGVPKCVLAAAPDLDVGAAAALLRRWAGDKRNVIILTDAAPRQQPPSIADLLEAGATTIDVVCGTRVPLRGAALATHAAARKERRDARDAAKRRDERTEEMARGVLQLDDDEPGRAAGALAGAAAAASKLTLGSAGDEAPLLKRRRLLESLKSNALFTRFAEPAFPMLCAPERWGVSDDYGASVPAAVEAAFAEARKSLLGLESRDGYGHLMSDERPELPQADAEDAAALSTANVADDAMDEEDDADAGLIGDDYDGGDDEDDDEADPVGATTKWEARTVSLDVQCKVVRVGGLGGLCDARSLKALLSRIAPRALIVTPSFGSADAARDLVTFAKSQLPLARCKAGGPLAVAAPSLGEEVDLSVWLGRAPLVAAELSWQLVEAQAASNVELGDGLVVCRVDAGLEEDTPRSAAKRQLLSWAEAAPRGGGLWLSAKDVVLPQLKERIEAAGIAATFRAGSLVCADVIVVRKEAAAGGEGDVANSRLVVDGPLCPEYFVVSGLVKSAFCLV
ncbi:beta-lactamase-like protein [Pelagophyceae sp. CCMP2097]|nr:beta-lactamase-like protein [Pelagophyceae sp. CCMP2097]|mmetsp:Transcript_15249/g.51261  ORF Transcript_15249/g.51261 Transcript_15249/m.51261 type:complete len:841 (-) Transcript_15249:72-2594(-)